MKKLNENLNLILACRVYLYKSFYLFFSNPLEDESIKFFMNDKLKNSFLLSQDIYNNMDYFDFMVSLGNNFANVKFKEDVGREYTRLMIGPHKLVAPPWESVYRKKENILFTEYSLAVREEYLKYNLLPQKYLQESDDHLSLELHYMLHLASLLVESNSNKVLNDSINFLDNHLLQWVEEYNARLKDEKSIYISFVSDYLCNFLKKDKSFLEQLQ